MTEDEIRKGLREMRDIAVPPDSLARVRLKLEHRIRRRVAWKVATFMMAASAVILAILLFGPIARRRGPAAMSATPRRPKVAIAGAPKPEKRPLERGIPAPLPAVRVRHRAHRKVPASAPVMIRIQTPDPDVLILLVGN